MADPEVPQIVSGRRTKLTRCELLGITGGTIGLSVFVVLAVFQHMWVYLAGSVVFLVANTVRSVRPPNQ